MHTKHYALAALLLAVPILAGAATASPTAANQRIAITFPAEPGNDTFVLTPLTRGPVVGDTGTASACCWTRRFTTRDGQSIEIDNPLRTYVGKRGTFTWRARIEFVDLDSSYTVATAPGGSCAGAAPTRTSRGTVVWRSSTKETQEVAFRAEGLVHLGG